MLLTRTSIACETPSASTSSRFAWPRSPCACLH
jgi:hypothetical protein